MTRPAHLRCIAPGLGAAALLLCAGTTFGQDQPLSNRERLAALGLQPGESDEGDDDALVLSAFSEPVQLSTLVEMVAQILEIEVIIRGSLSGTITFNSSKEIPRDQLLDHLDAWLGQHGFTIIQDDTGFYNVLPVSELPVQFQGDRATTRMFSVPNIKPSALMNAINAVYGQGKAPNRLAAIDELGVIVATDSIRRLDELGSIIDRLVSEYEKLQFIRIELNYIAAPDARSRAVELVGGSAADAFRQAAQRGRNQEGQTATEFAGTGLDNLSERLTIDKLGNALLFRGVPEEIEYVQDIVAIIDRPSQLEPRRYFAGSAARRIADLAEKRGLGEVIAFETFDIQRAYVNQQQGQQPFGIGNTGATSGGPIMVVDEEQGTIIYYATTDQHTQLGKLIEELDIQSEVPVIRAYKLRNAEAVKVAEVILGLIENRVPGGEGGLLPSDQTRRTPQQQQLEEFFGLSDESAQGELVLQPSEKIFVLADETNNQVLVKAPLKQQDDFAKLIEKLDLRKPQVYIQAQIVAISDQSTFRLAIEQQWIAGQFIAQTNFGLSTEPSGVTGPKTVAPDLAGLTSALIKSQYVPFIINALQRDVDAKILSSPQLLANDNEEATIVSLEEQPTTTTTTGNTTDQTSFGGYEQAGTTLTVTPTIADEGYLRLAYEVELSNFVGTSTSDGVPPPKQTRNVTSAVTIPSDTTIVVGGISVKDVRKTVAKIPLLGDIPLLGLLFSDLNDISNDAVLYVFITPRIMRDPNFSDLRLLTQGPQATSELDPDMPELQPVVMSVHDAGARAIPAGYPTLPEPEPVLLETHEAPAPVPAESGTPADTGDAGVVRRRED